MLSYDCYDFYCRGEHIIGVYTSKDLAYAARARHKDKDRDNEVDHYNISDEGFDANKDWE